MKSTNRELEVYAAVRLGWLEIRGDGSVWRVAQRRKSRWDGTVTVKPVQPHRIDTSVDQGYRQVKFMVDGIQRTCLAHRLVWLHLHGPIPEGQEVNHKNGKKFDNHSGNLELTTHSGNAKHAYRSGLNQGTHVEESPGAKLSDFDVEVIRVQYEMGVRTQKQIADDYGVSYQQISRIVRGERRQRQSGPVADYAVRRQTAGKNRCRARDQRGRYLS